MTSLIRRTFVAGVLVLAAGIAVARPRSDGLVILDARIADGTGAPLGRANLRIEAGRIASVGGVKPQAGDTVIDAHGLVVAPGFIDIHNHSTEGLAKEPAAESQVAQGITTVVVGADGSSPWPIGDYVAARRQSPAAVNVVVMAGHATIRRQVMGDDYKRPARDDEIAKMAQLVEQGMSEGAVGLSSGLEYEVGSYSETREVVEMAKAAAARGGFYMSHVRDEADKVFEAFREAIAIGEQAHVPVQISHIKLGTVGVWRRAQEAVRLIESARRRGVDVTADCYPYDAWHSTMTVLVPNKRYDDPASVSKALEDVGGAANITIDRAAGHPEYERKTLDAIARDQNITPVEAYIRIVRDGGATVICKSMIDEDIRTFYRRPWVMVASDGGIGMRHPRATGTFPRVLGRYVRERRWLSLPEAVRKMTSAPAARLKLTDRGRIAPGLVADLVLFDPDTVIDRSTFEEPALLPAGIRKVMVAGVLVWDEGKPTGARPGAVLP
jgi:N-acyl-D-amino-acid deacylase